MKKLQITGSQIIGMFEDSRFTLPIHRENPMTFPALRSSSLALLCGLALLSGCSDKNGSAASGSSKATTNASATASLGAVTADAKAPPYEATLEQGIDFSKTGYPSFLKDMSGLSAAETWGRWSDANLGAAVQFQFKDPLPQQFKLVMQVKDFYGVNAGQMIVVRVGKTEQQFMFDSADKIQHVELTFANVGAANTIEIIVPKHSEPTATDARKMGVGLVSLKIFP